MEFVPYRQLRDEPAVLRRKLEDEGALVVTLKDEPFAMMIDLAGSERLGDVLSFVSRLRAQMAARAIRSQARRESFDKMGAKQIATLIQTTRRKRQH